MNRLKILGRLPIHLSRKHIFVVRFCLRCMEEKNLKSQQKLKMHSINEAHKSNKLSLQIKLQILKFFSFSFVGVFDLIHMLTTLRKNDTNSITLLTLLVFQKSFILQAVHTKFNNLWLHFQKNVRNCVAFATINEIQMMEQYLMHRWNLPICVNATEKKKTMLSQYKSVLLSVRSRL